MSPELERTLKPTISRLADGYTLSESEAEEAFGLIMAGEATPAQIAGLVMMLRLRGETVAELVGAVRAMRRRMEAIQSPPGTIDVCGTGGDGAKTLNVSTAVTFVVAGAGVTVAKHGNRALSSKTGGADVLAALGVNLDVPLGHLEDVLSKAGCVFLFAPRHHAALRHAAGPRVELGTRTIFNLLGPLANPACVTRQLTGVFDPRWARPFAETLSALGTTDAWIVHGCGLDELTVSGHNVIVKLRNGQISEQTVHARELGLAAAPAEAIRGGEPEENAAALLAVLDGEPGAYCDTVLLNSAAALCVAGRAGDLHAGLELARSSIASGAARSALDRLKAATAF